MDAVRGGVRGGEQPSRRDGDERAVRVQGHHARGLRAAGHPEPVFGLLPDHQPAAGAARVVSLETDTGTGRYSSAGCCLFLGSGFGEVYCRLHTHACNMYMSRCGSNVGRPLVFFSLFFGGSLAFLCFFFSLPRRSPHLKTLLALLFFSLVASCYGVFHPTSLSSLGQSRLAVCRTRGWLGQRSLEVCGVPVGVWLECVRFF